MVTKSEFLRRKKMQGLSTKQKNERWQQHLRSEQGTDTPKRSVQSAPRQQSRAKPVKSGVKCCDSAKSYAYALLDPFNAPPVGVPYPPALKSRKVKVFIKGTMTTGPNGFGQCAMSPSLANNNNCLWTSSGVDNASKSVLFSGTSVTPHAHNGPVTAAELQATGVQGRVVAAGCRVRYSGSELNRSGSVWAFEQTNHGDISNMTIAQMAAYDRAHSKPVGRDWHTVTWQPMKSTELDYFYADPSNTPIMALLIQCDTQATTGLSFEFEFYQIMELQGDLIIDKTFTSVAVDDTSNVMAFAGQVGNVIADKITSEGSRMATKYGPSILWTAFNSFMSPNGFVNHARMVEM